MRTLDPFVDIAQAMPERPEWVLNPVTPAEVAFGTLDERVRSELSKTDGTPEWRAWVTAAAERHHIEA